MCANWTHYVVLPCLQALTFRKPSLLPSSGDNDRRTQLDQWEWSHRWLHTSLKSLYLFTWRRKKKQMSKFYAFKPRKYGGNVQCGWRCGISCLTDTKKACVWQCTCSWGQDTIERRERLTNCWLHSATQQHWGTHICIILALQLDTYKTPGVARLHNRIEARTYALY